MVTVTSEKGESWSLNDALSLPTETLMKWSLLNKLPAKPITALLVKIMSSGDPPKEPGKSLSASGYGWTVTVTNTGEKSPK